MEDIPLAAGIRPTSWAAGVAGDSHSSPKKRAIVLTAFLACLSFLLLVINTVVSFATDLIQNQQLWTYLQKAEEKGDCSETAENKTENYED
jgi:hypothetical protein